MSWVLFVDSSDVPTIQVSSQKNPGSRDPLPQTEEFGHVEATGSGETKVPE